MDKQEYANQIGKLLNSSSDSTTNFDASEDYEEYINSEIEQDETKMNASALARIKYREQAAARNKSNRDQKEQQKIAENIAELEVIEQSPKAQTFLSQGMSDITPYAGTTKRDVVKLLSSLNINMSLYLDKADTYNLLSCLLTANEQQLDALYNNKKVPIAIKIVIKRLKEDAKLGNIDTIERLWDRVFGKNQSAGQIQLPEGIAPGLLPNTVVSREAYMIIRDTVIGK